MLKLIFRILYILFVLFETLLGIRFLFLMIHIPTSVPIASWVYSNTQWFIHLFSGTSVSNFEILGFLVDIKTFIAIIVVSIINWGITEIIKALN